MKGTKIRTPGQSPNRYSSAKRKNLREHLLLFLVVAVLIWVIAGPFGLFRLYRLKQWRTQLRTQNTEMAQRIAALKEEIHGLKTNRALQEQLVKSELGWVRDTEIIYIFHNE